MRNVLTLGGLAVVVLLIIAGGPAISDTKIPLIKGGQSAASVLMYDEGGKAQIVEEAWPGSITDNPSDVFYTSPGVYVPETYYSSDPYRSYYSPYDDYDYVYYDRPANNRMYYDYRTYTPAPPPPPPQPWYVQALPGVGSVAQTIVQGIAPQTRARPTCSIAVNPSFVQFGGSTQLRWLSQGAEWADLTELGSVDTAGSWQFDDLTRSRVFTLNVSGPGGSATCSAALTVMPRR